MKKVKVMAMAIMAVLTSVNLISCNNDEDWVEAQSDEYVTVKLGCAGEFLNITTSPMSRTENNDLYLINIKEQVTYNYGDYTYEDEEDYACGIFDNVEDMSVNLLKNRKYKFYVSVIINGKSGNYNFGYYHSCNNEFSYKANNQDYYELYVSEIYDGQFEFDRFYGEKEFTAEEGQNTLTIDLIRVAYKVVGKASGLTEAGGILTLTFEPDRGDYFTMELASDDKPQEITRTMDWMSYVYRSYMEGTDDDQTISANLSIVWTKADDTAKGMGTYNIIFERGKVTTITITPQDLDHPITLSINLGDKDWTVSQEYNF